MAVLEPAALTSPLVIGGVGGSGTRVVVAIAEALGFRMGPMTPHGDHVLFSPLVVFPAVVSNPGSLDELNANVARLPGLVLFEKLVLRKQLSISDLELAHQLFEPFAKYTERLPPEWRVPIEDAFTQVRSGGFEKGPLVGWKEPNTSVLLEVLCDRFPAMRYVHVSRHGLDMAFSKNNNQLHSWGHLFGVSGYGWKRHPFAEPVAKPTPSELLRFWVRTTCRTLEIASRRLPGRYLHVHFDELCLDPARALAPLCEFLEVAVSDEDLARLSSIPRRPASLGRHLEEDLAQFHPEDLAAVRDLGFEVPGNRDA